MPKKGHFVTRILFQDLFLLKSHFLVFWGIFGVHVFGPSCQRRLFWTRNLRQRKCSLITEKLLFCYFLVFFLILFLEGLGVRWGGPKGHLTWPSALFILFFWKRTKQKIPACPPKICFLISQCLPFFLSIFSTPRFHSLSSSLLSSVRVFFLTSLFLLCFATCLSPCFFTSFLSRTSSNY